MDNWIVNQSVDPKDSASQAGLSVSTTTSRSSIGSSKLKLREARERRELARPRIQQLATALKKYGGGVGRSREGVSHEVLSLVQGVGRAIFSYP